MGVLPVLRSSLLAMAAELDLQCSARSLLSASSGRAYGLGPLWTKEVPTIVLELTDIAAILKPAHWEVDARVGGSPPPQDFGAPLLSSFLRKHFAKEEFPLVHCNEQQFGIIHRLDTPSSGLILVGKSFLGYYTLRLQQDTYELGREYLVLCHGRLPWGPRVISAKIKTSKAAPVTSMISSSGKPAWTRVEPLLVAHRKNAPDKCYTVVAIKIRTGRTHQIRVHMKHIGHPTVTDGKYTDQVVYSEDKTWCPRNFLHRFRLTFEDTTGTTRAVVAPLPPDLAGTLGDELVPMDVRSEQVLRQVIAGWVPDRGEER